MDINPNDLIPRAAARFNGPGLFPRKNSEFLIANITPCRSLLEQSIK